ncbi:hypothetical protein BY996DRAFT_7489904 [Phakopsora pachyrhizi]|nr:hypothetical protein BY996DRAFT_7489904 [Phakopsora pachyrhizi]
MHLLEQNRDEVNANLIKAKPIGKFNPKSSKIVNAKNSDGTTLRSSRPLRRVIQFSDSDVTARKIETYRLKRIKDNDKNLAGTSKKRKKETGEANIEVFQDTIENKELIIASLKKNFWVDSGHDKLMSSNIILLSHLLKKVNLDLEKVTDINILNFGAKFDKQAEEQVEEITKGISFFPMNDGKNVSLQIFKMKYRLHYSIKSIRWNKYDDFVDNISQIFPKINSDFDEMFHSGAQKNIENFSTIATIFMKVISSFFSHHKNSDRFGNEEDIIDYLKIFWKTCITRNQDLQSFCKSIGASSESAKERCLSTGLENNGGLGSIFERLERDVFSTHMNSKVRLQLAWSLVSVRFSFFYPEKVLRLKKSNTKHSLISLVENALLYFIIRS